MNRPRDISWQSIITRPGKFFPLGEDIESFASVKCPKSGHVEKSDQLRVFGFIPGAIRIIRIVLGILLGTIILFGFGS